MLELRQAGAGNLLSGLGQPGKTSPAINPPGPGERAKGEFTMTETTRIIGSLIPPSYQRHNYGSRAFVTADGWVLADRDDAVSTGAHDAPEPGDVALLLDIVRERNLAECAACPGPDDMFRGERWRVDLASLSLEQQLEYHLLQSDGIPYSIWHFPVALIRDRELLLVQMDVDHRVRLILPPGRIYPDFPAFFARELAGCSSWGVLAPVACEVYAAGVRGNHSCTGRLIVAVGQLESEVARAITERGDCSFVDPRFYHLHGDVLAVEDCPRCGAFRDIEAGDAVIYSGWFNPEYYEHEGLQL